MKIFVGGVNGSGKTTLLTQVSEQSHYPVIHATGAFMQYLGYGNDYDELRALPDDVRDIKLAQFMKELLEKNGSFLLDSHYLNLVRGHISRVTADWIKQFDALILITAPLEILWQRVRAGASLKDRALFPHHLDDGASKDILRDYQDKTRDEFEKIASEYNIPSLQVKNEDLNKAANKVCSFIASLSVAQKK